MRAQDAAKSLQASLSRVLYGPESEIETVDIAPKLLLACMPKSGSTWLTTLIERHLELPGSRCYLEPDRNEQELDPLQLFSSIGTRAFFVQQHLRASSTTLRLCRAFSVKIVVLTRNLEDVVLSFQDQLLNQSPIAPMFYVEREWFAAMTNEQQLDFLVELCLPWYINFLVGWLRARDQHPSGIRFQRYEDMVRHPVESLQGIARFYGTEITIKATDVDVRQDVRFNQGKIGRGNRILSVAQKRKIERFTKFYLPHVPDCRAYTG